MAAKSRYFWLTAACAAALVATSLQLRVFTQDAPQEGQPPAAPAGGRGGGRGTVQPGGRGPSIGSAGGQMVGDPANAGIDFSPKPAIVALSPEEEARHFILPPGYRVELVLEDKDVISPAAMAFDGDGRLYIAEMRTFMRDADATGQLDPISRVSMHESTKHDGKFDRHTVFADHLLLPRMVLPLEKGILINETHSDDLVLLTDTNGDGVADKRQVFFTGVGSGRDGNVQHEQSGLIWGLDNWIYSTYNAFRIRWTPNGIVREPSGSSGAEWGLSMDDDGKMWFVNSGGERGPVAFEVPIQYGAYNTPDQLEPGFEIVYPAPGIGDMQGGAPRVRMPFNNLNHLTSSAAPEIVRSDRYPADMNGDLLFCDFVGRLIRRAKVTRSEGLTQLKNVYPGAEFMVSTDPLFRPINIKQGPDGALYILDWYQGIMQDVNWTGRGNVPAHEDRAVRAGQSHQPRARLAAGLRGNSRDGAGVGSDPAGRAGHRIEQDLAAHERRDARAAGRAPHEPDRLVARHCAAAAGAQAGQVGGAGLAADDAQLEQPGRAVPRDVDARGAGRAGRRARAGRDEGSEPAYAGAGDSRERDALQVRHALARDGLSGAPQGRGS